MPVLNPFFGTFAGRFGCIWKQKWLYKEKKENKKAGHEIVIPWWTCKKREMHCYYFIRILHHCMDTSHLERGEGCKWYKKTKIFWKAKSDLPGLEAWSQPNILKCLAQRIRSVKIFLCLHHKFRRKNSCLIEHFFSFSFCTETRNFSQRPCKSCYDRSQRQVPDKDKRHMENNP